MEKGVSLIFEDLQRKTRGAIPLVIRGGGQGIGVTVAG